MNRRSDANFCLSRIKELILSSCGHSFDHERERSLLGAIERRMKYRGMVNLEEYTSELHADGQELLRLTEHLTVKETYFFREPDHLNLVVDKLLPELLERKRGGVVRIVSAGCSSGEEPYSIAIMALEKFGLTAAQQLAVVGMDIDSNAVEGARRGIYPKTSFRGDGHHAFARYFEETGPDAFRVLDEVKKIVAFGTVNLLSESYPVQMEAPDIIFYRNVSIYFPEELQKRIFKRLAGLLREGGSLIVGAAETIYHDIGVLTLAEEEGLFFYRKAPPLKRSEPARVESHPRGSVPVNVTRRDAEVPVNYVEATDPRADGETRRTIEEAESLAIARQSAKALNLLRSLEKERPLPVAALSLKGWLALGESHIDEARQAAEALRNLDSLNRDAYLILGMIARQEGDTQSAMERLREVIYLDATCWLAHFYLGELHYGRQEGKRARASFEIASKILGDPARSKQPGDRVEQLVNPEQCAVICRHKLSLLKESV